MLDDLSRIQSRIQEIQSRIAALTPPAAIPSEPPAPEQAGPEPFAQTLQRARESPPAAPRLPEGPSHVYVPPASLGPLPVMPGAADVAPVKPMTADAYAPLAEKYAGRHGVPPALVKAVIQMESGGNPRAVSPAGAMGLMQLMPANVKEAGITDPFDPEQNIAAGTQQLAGLLNHYGGDLDLALAGYNAGPGNVRKYGGVPPFAETRNYIRKVRAAMEKG